MERFTKIVNGKKSLNIFVKRSIVDVWLSSEYVSGSYYKEDLGLHSEGSRKLTSNAF